MMTGRCWLLLRFFAGIWLLVQPSYAQTGMQLADGRFETTTDVSSWTKLALDLAAMRDTDDSNIQRQIYDNGQNARPRTLASLSLESYPLMKDDPLYNYYRHAFTVIGNNVESEDLGNFDEKPVEQYADTLVQDLFDLTVPFIEAEAAIVYNVWMYISHQLNQVLGICKANGSSSEMNAALDIAAALWVGEDQPQDSSERGNLLYNLAQVAGRRFEQANAEAEANTLVLDAMLKIQTGIANNQCSTSEGYLEMRVIVNDLIGHMTIPLVQQLIHHIMQQPADGGSDFIEMYTLSIAPRVLVCDPALYDELMTNMVFGDLPSDADSKMNAINLVRIAFSCLGVTCEQVGSYESGELSQCSDEPPGGPKPLGGYNPTYNVDQYAFLDRDIIQIQTLLRLEAKDAALDIYENGFNSRTSESKYLSLQDLATNVDLYGIDQFVVFSTYFGADHYADLAIEKAFLREPPFDGASARQLSGAVGGTLAYSVTYMSVLQLLNGAIAECVNGGDTSGGAGLRLWDFGVAMFVGSTEGLGESLFGAAKALCPDFGTCLESGNAEVNDQLINAFREGSNDLRLGNCNEAQVLLQDSIIGLLLVPLIQGTLHYAFVNSKLDIGSTDASLGIGYAFAESVLPLVNNADMPSATTVASNMHFDLTTKPVPDGAEAVFEAFRSALPNMKTRCELIGTHQAGSLGNVCPAGASVPSSPPGPAPTPGQPTSTSAPTPTPAPISLGPAVLGFGRYSFSTDVSSVSRVALDVRDMRSSSLQEARNIYESGRNSEVVENGATQRVSLASFSVYAGDYMAQDPLFNIYRYALLNDTVFGDGSVAADSAYADTVVQKAFSVPQDPTFAAEASVVMNVWMDIAHRLQESTRACFQNQKATGPLDEAAALWLGAEQVEQSSSGYLMYSIAQIASSRMGRGDGEARVNTVLFELFNQAKMIGDTCADNDQNPMKLRQVVSKITRELTIPLFQNLMFYIHRAKETIVTNQLELYSLALLPQAMGCDPDIFFSLEDVLLDTELDTGNLNQEFFEKMRGFQKCLRISCDDIFDGQIDDQALRSTVQDLCYPNIQDPFISIAGYKPTTDVREYSRLDLDILQIGIFMETKAYDAAVEWYLYGHNNEAGMSLGDLATDPNLKLVPQYELFRQYFGANDYADELILDVMEQEGKFAKASRSQLTEVAVTALQGMVGYMTVLRHLYQAVGSCEEGGNGSKDWDKAVAIFVGYMEGEKTGGNIEGYGQMLYALGKDTCDDFGTCEASGDSTGNEELMEAFTDGQRLISDMDCNGASVVIRDRMLRTLPIPLIQGTLYFATVLEQLQQGTTDESLGTGYALSRSIIPIVKNSNSESAATIETQMDFVLDQPFLQGGSAAIFSAIETALPGMNIPCGNIGVLDGRSVCSGGSEVAPTISKPTNLGDGLYTTTTYVQDRANIALDVLAIRNALSAGTVDLAELLYKDGENSAIYDENGVKVGQRSLKAFSTTATTLMMNEPAFNIVRYALQDEDGQYLGQHVRLYADSIVSEAFRNSNPSSKTLAAEAMVALNLWMFLVHELQETMENCKDGDIADTDGVHSIDEAVAYWIGDGQVTGDPQQGHLLYALAEQMGELFNSDEAGQSRVNRNILRLFNQAKLELSFPNACIDNPDTFPRLRQVVNKIISWMTVPLIQGLIHNLKVNDRDRVKLYAQAFVPFVSGCSPTTFEYLSDKLISLTYNVVEVEDLIKSIQSTFSCFRLSCEDIGIYQNDSAETCVDYPMSSPIAGYRPQADARAHSMLDLDILHSRILMEMGAMEAVEDLYTYGQHAVVDGINGPETLSLHQLATTSQRTLVPEFDSFVRYYEDDKYADTLIRKALNPDEISAASPEQRRALVVTAMQYLVIHMASLELMHQSIADCESSQNLRLLDGQESWDRAAALLLGSLEGTENGGSDHGLSFYGLAKERCAEFNTCTETGNAEVNEQLFSLLYTGRGAVSTRSCGALRKAVKEIEPLLLVPLIQSTLSSAVKNAKLDTVTRDEGLAEGYVFSRSLLPLIEDSNRDAAASINRNMDFQFVRKPVVDGAATVFNQFAKAYSGMGVMCELVGTTKSFDACNGATSSSGGSSDNLGLIVGVVSGVCAAAAIGVFLLYTRRKRRAKKLDGRPEFVPSPGEFNHNLDFLNGVRDDNLAQRIVKHEEQSALDTTVETSEGAFT